MEPRNHRPQLVAITAAKSFVADTRPRLQLPISELESQLPTRRVWFLHARRREELFSSDAAFLVSTALTIVGSGVLAYFYGFWTIPGAS